MPWPFVIPACSWLDSSNHSSFPHAPGGNPDASEKRQRKIISGLRGWLKEGVFSILEMHSANSNQ
jgi:hypothetical protein